VIADVIPFERGAAKASVILQAHSKSCMRGGLIS
jgi:hypothetical protein